MTLNIKPDILILEDSPTLVQRYIGMLDAYQCEIKIASNVKDALSIMIENEFDLYIIDLFLDNDIDGSDIIGKAGADPNKCVIISGKLNEDIIKNLVTIHRVPRDQIMNKPPDMHHFIELLNIKLTSIKENKSSKDLGTDVPSFKPEELITSVKDHIVFPAVITIIKNLSISHWFLIISILISMPTLLTTYASYRGWHEKVKFEKIIESECNTRFENFRKGDSISSRTYIEEIRVLDTIEFIIRAYPDNFVSVLITSTNNKFEPRKFWLVGPDYAKQKGLDKEKSLLDVVKNIIGV